MCEEEGRPALTVRWLGRIADRDAWWLQQQLASWRADDEIGDQLLLLEHDPVLTLGRYADEAHIRATPAELGSRGIEAIRVERGGEVTYHGPGQLVAYPVLSLSRHGLMIRPLVRALEDAMIAACAEAGVVADRREGHPGCWVDPTGAEPRKIGALGIRVQRGVSFHGIALNVTTDLRDFELIDPCGLPGVTSTSIARELGRHDAVPSTASVEHAGRVFARALGDALGVELVNAADAADLAGRVGAPGPARPLAGVA